MRLNYIDWLKTNNKANEKINNRKPELSLIDEAWYYHNKWKSEYQKYVKSFK